MTNLDTTPTTPTLIGADGKPREVTMDDFIAVLMGLRPTNVAEGCFCGQCGKDDPEKIDTKNPVPNDTASPLAATVTKLFGRHAADVVATPAVLERVAKFSGPNGEFFAPETVLPVIDEKSLIDLVIESLKNGVTTVSFEQMMRIMVLLKVIATPAPSLDLQRKLQSDFDALEVENDDLKNENDDLTNENDRLRDKFEQVRELVNDCDCELRDDCGCGGCDEN